MNPIGKIDLDGYLTEEENLAIETMDAGRLFDFSFEIIAKYNEVWSLSNGERDLLIPTINSEGLGFPIFPSKGVATGVYKSVVFHEINRPILDQLRDLSPRVYTIENFTDDIIKVLDNNKSSELKIIMYNYSSAIDISTKEFLKKLSEFR